ncbi:hypothetical protein MtrunA17_Chr2g0322651 [Medicago truncatula]|uniref:DUF4228 domain protein n=1 Tax=Medicago truncatula TaxID=3880 RepID=G7ITZ6_MEDTR|nr:uncharacterized protein LOC11413961 [Medicago truncatula]AES67240.1 DUF4228 domain protein [Medicago truncatula]AFK34382.1 unknown [Medicago truncatula]RHN75566.1 hypothetical protein MtrunA17_Chr2g0322651 [Medicago truncatula]
MGNCIRKNQISSAQYENEEIKKVEKMKAPKSSRREDSLKKKVRFKIQDGNKGNDGNSSTSGIMRIKLVVSKEELKRVLSNKNIENGVKNTSLEELLKDMKLKEKSVSRVEEIDDGGLDSWKPALDSIPEDHSMKL